MKAKYQQANAKLVAKLEEVKSREARVGMLEEGWKAHAREELEGEIRGAVEDEICECLIGVLTYEIWCA